jgi:hypothetical protein
MPHIGESQHSVETLRKAIELYRMLTITAAWHQLAMLRSPKRKD